MHIVGFPIIWPSGKAFAANQIGILHDMQHLGDTSSGKIFPENLVFFPDNFIGIDWPAVSNCLKIPSPWESCQNFSDIFDFIASVQFVTKKHGRSLEIYGDFIVGYRTQAGKINNRSLAAHRRNRKIKDEDSNRRHVGDMRYRDWNWSLCIDHSSGISFKGYRGDSWPGFIKHYIAYNALDQNISAN